MDSTLELLASAPLTNKKNRLDLRIEARGANYSFYYTENGGLKLLKDSVDGRFLSTKTAGGFVGTVFGLYVESGGQASKNKATFQWFEYRGNDPLYKKR